MRLPLALLVVLSSTTLSGCFGGGCGGADYGAGNRTSAGSYSGTYTNTTSVGTSGAAKDLDLRLAVSDAGEVTGAATEPTSGETATVTGNVGDYFASCSSDTTTLTLRLAFSGGASRTLQATRTRSDLSDFTRVSTTYADDGGTIGRGRIALTKTNP